MQLGQTLERHAKPAFGLIPVLRSMKHLRTFIPMFIVLFVVFLLHTDSNLWIKYPDRMVLKDKATIVEHVFLSALLAGFYSVGGVGISALVARLWRVPRNAEPGAAPNGGPARRPLIRRSLRGRHR